jgi:hypothetical protein
MTAEPCRPRPFPATVRVRLASALACVLVPVMLSASLAGCAAALGAGTVALTDKTPVDHVASLISGKDCSTVRRQRGLTYCVEDETIPPVLVHCYPTLGEATCYAQPDPFPGRQRKLGSEPAAAIGGG